MAFQIKTTSIKTGKTTLSQPYHKKEVCEDLIVKFKYVDPQTKVPCTYKIIKATTLKNVS